MSFILPLFFGIAILWLAVPALVAQDAQRHGESGLLWWLLTMFGGVIGIVAWLVVRRRLPDGPPYLRTARVTPLTLTILVPAAVFSLAAFAFTVQTLVSRPTAVQGSAPAPTTPPSPVPTT